MASVRRRTVTGRLWRVIANRLAIVLGVLVILIAVTPWLSFVEVRALDFVYALRPPRQPDPRIEIVDAGADPGAYESLRDPRDSPNGGCEVPRRAYAEAVRRLSRWGAKVIVLDLMFIRRCEYEDKELAEACRQAGNVIVAATTKTGPGAVGLQGPVKPLDEAVRDVGSPAAYQPGGTVRSIPLVVRDRDSGRGYLAISLLAFQRFRGAEPEARMADGGRVLETAGVRVPVLPGERISLLDFGEAGDAVRPDESGAAEVRVVRGSNIEQIPGLRTWSVMLVNWVGGEGTMRPHQLSDLLAMNDDQQGRKLFGGKAVLIGRADWDVKWTAVGPMSGLEIHADALQTLMSGSFIRPISPWGMMGLLVLFIAATTSAVRRLRGMRAVGAVLLVMFAGVVIARQLMTGWGIWMYLFCCEFGICLTWGVTAVAESGKMTALVRRFVPSFIGKPEASGPREVRTMDASILFSDIRGYTGTAEQLSAADTMAILGTYHSTVEDIIARHGGSVVKTPGDAILAVFWRDGKGLNHATCALRAGQEILRDLPEMERAWGAVGARLEIGIGINAGPVAMGIVGTRHLEPTVIGDAVNVAQRLEGLTKTLGYPLIFSESVCERLSGDDARAVCLDEVTVRGRQMPIRIYGAGGRECPGQEPEQHVGPREKGTG